MLTLNPDDLSQIPQIYKWKEQADSLELSSDLHTHAVAHGCAYTHTHTKYMSVCWFPITRKSCGLP